MTAATSTAARRIFVPEVIQTSAMDCGPAALKALLEGFGVPVSYSRLRELCQTDVDGTSIDAIEGVAVQLGLNAAQFIVPVDHLLMEEADSLPAMVVTRLPNGLTHFVVVWRTHPRVVQVMDPGAGRLWRTRRRFLRDVFVHHYPAPEDLALEWLTAPAFLDPLRRRLSDLGFSSPDVDQALGDALASERWLPVAALDAAARLSARLVRARAVQRGVAAVSLVKRLAAEAARRGVEGAMSVLPPQDWSVGVSPSGELSLRGAVILHVAGKTTPEAAQESGAPAPPEVAAVLGQDSHAPIRSILRAALEEYPLGLLAVPLAMLLAGAAVGLEALLFNGLIGVAKAAGTPTDAREALWLVGSFLCVVFLLNLSLSAVLLHLGRWLDLHLRIRLLEKLPRLGNYYFRSRLKSDLAQRAHELRTARLVPQLVFDGLRVVSEIALTAGGIVWLVPGSALPIVLVLTVIVGLFLALFPVLREQDLRRETHASVLTQFHLDSLLGLTPIKAHCAEEPMRAEHEGLLVKWAAATREFYWTHIGGLAVGLLAGTLLATWTVRHSMAQGASGAAMLLVVYWALKLPLLLQDLVNVLRQAPTSQNRLLRLFDVLSGPEESDMAVNRGSLPRPPRRDAREKRGTGAHVIMCGVGVHAAGQRILSDVELQIRPGEHVAVVGPSGSGKTSLVGLLLGWHRASEGSVWVDGELASAEQIQRLRRKTAWVDPAVQIWNRSLSQNLRYGNGEDLAQGVRDAVKSADLAGVVERLPEGMESSLGEGGGLISGGEGQRVRLARAMLRKDARLVILDEPFRGLDRDKRRELLAMARLRFRDATLIYISHDIGTTLDFERVLVLDGGRVVEDGAPRELLESPGSRFSALREAERAVEDAVWRSPIWRRWWMDRGELRGDGGKASP
jgi:ATP-binding cassette subfamily B protein